MLVELLRREGLLVVVRCRAPLDVLLEVGDALLAAPAPLVAVCPGGLEPWTAVAELRARFGRNMLVGVGMAAGRTEVEAAVGAGAQFVMAGRLDSQGMTACAALCAGAGAAYLPAVQTPVEVQAAAALGCTGVTVLPACRIGVAGLGPLREAAQRASFERLASQASGAAAWGAEEMVMVAAGGVPVEEIGTWRRAGATAVVVRGVLAAGSRWDMGTMIRTVRKIRG